LDTDSTSGSTDAVACSGSRELCSDYLLVIFIIFQICRVEAVVIVQRKEVPYRQRSNFRPKMAVRSFVLRDLFVGKP